MNVTDIAKSSVVTPALALKANTADLKEIGVGQTWQNVTASRTAGATYTNTTGKPIFVAYNNIKVGSNGVKITVDGLLFYSTVYNSISANHDGNVIAFIVPNNSTYRADATEGTLEFLWYELR